MEKIEILEKYIEYVSRTGKRPHTVSEFTSAISLKESEYYTHFSSIRSVEQFYWYHLHQKLIEKLTAQEVYAKYSVREKLLSYAFTLVEHLKENRSFVLLVLRANCNALDTYKKELKNHTETLILEGTKSNEIQDRIFISAYYSDIVAQVILGTINFWSKDESANFEKTDAFIEKSLNFIMDILSRNWLDTGFDFLKYIFQKN